MIYRTLNNEAKNWWYHLELRKKGHIVEARKRERGAIKNKIKNLRKILEVGGYLSLGNAGWTLHSNSFKTSDTSSQSFSVQGYYDLNKYCYLEDICKQLGIVVVDTRNIDPFIAVNRPMKNFNEGYSTDYFNRTIQWAKDKKVNLIIHNFKGE